MHVRLQKFTAVAFAALAISAVATTQAASVILGTQPYNAGEHKAFPLPADVRWNVLPVYLGINAEGERFTVDRITIVLEDEANSFWPLVARLDDDEATALHDALQTLLDSRPTDRAIKPGIRATTYAFRHGLTEHGVVQLPDELPLRVLPEYRGIGADGEQIRDSRITLVLDDTEGRFWPFIAHMHDDQARSLRDGLARELATRRDRG